MIDRFGAASVGGYTKVRWVGDSSAPTALGASILLN